MKYFSMIYAYMLTGFVGTNIISWTSAQPGKLLFGIIICLFASLIISKPVSWMVSKLLKNRAPKTS